MALKASDFCQKTYTASLVIADNGGRATLETGPHASAAEAMAALAALIHRLKPKDRAREKTE